VEEEAATLRIGQRLHHCVEAPLLQDRGDRYDLHVSMRPCRWRCSPVAPMCSTLRAAARFAARIASSSGSPASRRLKHVAPHTSPQPVGSPSRGSVTIATFSLRAAPGTPRTGG